MDKPVLQSRSGAALAQSSILDLKRAVHGEVVVPSDDHYHSARKIWNASIDKYPGMIARCAGVADVVEAVKFARAQRLVVAVRGGGHNVGGRALCDGGIVIDLSAMKSVFVDPDRRTVRVQGGATLGDVDRETHLFGLAVPLGVVSRTGVAGLTLGGGVGWLVRKHGLTCDNVLAFEVVMADGSHRYCQRRQECRSVLGAARWRRQFRHRHLVPLPSASRFDGAGRPHRPCPRPGRRGDPPLPRFHGLGIRGAHRLCRPRRHA